MVECTSEISMVHISFLEIMEHGVCTNTFSITSCSSHVVLEEVNSDVLVLLHLSTDLVKQKLLLASCSQVKRRHADSSLRRTN